MFEFQEKPLSELLKQSKENSGGIQEDNHVGIFEGTNREIHESTLVKSPDGTFGKIPGGILSSLADFLMEKNHTTVSQFADAFIKLIKLK